MYNSDIMVVEDKRVNGLRSHNVFVGSAKPELSWQISRGRQSAYRIIAASKRELLQAGPDLWDSGKVNSSESIFLPWGGKSLRSGMRVFWQVIVWDETGVKSAPSEVADFEISLLENREWNANWISLSQEKAVTPRPCPYFRREFVVRPALAQARIRLGARGVAEAHLNGQRIAADYFVPGWTDFQQQIQFISYDVTSLIHTGVNAIGAILGEGWYCGYYPGRLRNHYGDYPELLMRLELQYADGTIETITTGEGWQAKVGPIMYSDLFSGEEYDARMEFSGWDIPGFDASDWQTALLGESAEEAPSLFEKCCEPVRSSCELTPVRVLNPKQGVYIWDFGQNIAGIVRFRPKIKHDSLHYELRYGEMLYPDNTLYNLNYRSATSVDTFIDSATRNDDYVWEPHFTLHGFRYCQVIGIGAFETTPDDFELTALALNSIPERTGNFRCGNEKLNQLYRNIVWSQLGNYVELPTDCPQRDERLGWSGDAHFFIETAAFNYNVDTFFRKWLRDLRETQRDDGAIASVAPYVDGFQYGSTAWADAIVICPYTLYRRYGDRNVVAENYPAMKRWVAYQRDNSDDMIISGHPDHLSLAKNPASSRLIGTAFFYNSASLTARCARILGETDDAISFEHLARQVRTAFRKNFIGQDGALTEQTQTSLVLALRFDLFESCAERQANIRLLAEEIRNAGYHLTTGFIGTAYLNQTLCKCGLNNEAYAVLLQEQNPSWLYQINHGATTVWERWDSWTLENGFADITMNSFNHYACGAVGAFMSENIAGIRFDFDNGLCTVHFEPLPDRRLGFAKAELLTPCGLAFSHWFFDANDKLHWTLEVPPNTTGLAKLPPGAPDEQWGSGDKLFGSKSSITLDPGNYKLTRITPAEINSRIKATSLESSLV